jgi:hypothetical protein
VKFSRVGRPVENRKCRIIGLLWFYRVGTGIAKVRAEPG